MSSKFIFTASVIIMVALCGCGSNLTGPEEELIGTWRFVGAAIEEDNRILDQLLGPGDTVRLFFARKV